MKIISSRLIIGLCILLVGVVWFLNNLDVGIEINLRRILSFWPAIPLVLGLNWIFLAFRFGRGAEEGLLRFSWGQFVTGLIMAVFGGVYLGRSLGLLSNLDTRLFWNYFWPVVLILIGISLLRGRKGFTNDDGRFVIMSGAEIGGKEPWPFRGGSYFAFMGGIEMDLRKAELSDGETILDLTALMGGITVTLPRGVAAVYEGSAVLGGITFLSEEEGGIVAGNKKSYNMQDNPRSWLRFQARALMGGIEINED